MPQRLRNTFLAFLFFSVRSGIVNAISYIIIVRHLVKQEIKHTLQNKLHRCAGPEDLVAAHKMLQRLLADRHSYSEGFINEFIKFHEVS